MYKTESKELSDSCKITIHFNSDFKAKFELVRMSNIVFNIINICAGEEVFFDELGDASAYFDILNWRMYPNGANAYVKVGTFDSRAPEGKRIAVNESHIMWSKGYSQIPKSVCSDRCRPGHRKAVQLGQPICCFDCLLCPPGEVANQSDSNDCMRCPDDQCSDANGMMCIPKIIEFLSFDDHLGSSLAAVSLFLCLLNISILCIFIKNRETPIVKANNRELSFVLLSALALSFLCALIFIGQPGKVNCLLRQVAFGIIFSFSVSAVLGKTTIVFIAFSATKPNSPLQKLVGSKVPYTLVCFCSLIQILMCLLWLLLFPPFPEHNTKSNIDKILIECNENSVIMFYCMLGYMGILSSVSFVVAFLVRKLPNGFNEAKYITFSMLVFVSVWLTFIPAYLSTQGKYMVAVEIFAIMSSSAGLLCCIFVPKCYIIIFKPHKNTREYIADAQEFSVNREAHGECLEILREARDFKAICVNGRAFIEGWESSWYPDVS
ncbi:vomeronasal type-2 receptor 26-like [Protopterus annectens]|uniref:vomeronasal type-2 receptor 26-like n=1 Tax=Protopterus annectens TaxID=7888 RepID=UPI001CFA2D66|nr:vomeronasal type-2 receptor 26-like [Protopterus annectens]